MTRFYLSIALFAAALALEPFVSGSAPLHVLVQLPLLAAAGFLPGHHLQAPRGVTGAALILAGVTAAIWMLPRTVDAALIFPGWALAKFVTLPLLLGLPLAIAWRGLGPLGRGVIKAQTISMLLFLAFLYTHAPVRLCNSYLVQDQIRLGAGFAWLALGLAVIWLVPPFLGASHSSTKDDTYELRAIRHQFR